MKDANVDPAEIDEYAEQIYNAVKEFIQNTEFSVPVYKDKY